MTGIARMGDACIGICTAHKKPLPVNGVIVSGSPTVNIGGVGAARIGDTVISSCGHTGLIVSSSPTISGGAMPLARMGDSFQGVYSGTIISGAPTVNGP
jgi:uncharacterized Zn-binding protein involved in type VI secretion